MNKKAIIVISLVSESIDVSNNQIKKEIQKEASIPWVKEIEKVTIIEKCR